MKIRDRARLFGLCAAGLLFSYALSEAKPRQSEKETTPACSTKSAAENCNLPTPSKKESASYSMGEAIVVARILSVKCGAKKTGLQEYVARALVETVFKGAVGGDIEVHFYRAKEDPGAKRAAAAMSGIVLNVGERAEMSLVKDPQWTVVSPQDVRPISAGTGKLPKCGDGSGEK